MDFLKILRPKSEQFQLTGQRKTPEQIQSQELKDCQIAITRLNQEISILQKEKDKIWNKRVENAHRFRNDPKNQNLSGQELWTKLNYGDNVFCKIEKSLEQEENYLNQLISEKITRLELVEGLKEKFKN